MLMCLTPPFFVNPSNFILIVPVRGVTAASGVQAQGHSFILLRIPTLRSGQARTRAEERPGKNKKMKVLFYCPKRVNYATYF